MTQEIFEQVYKWEAEKGISNNKDDKGGITNDGITLEHYNLLCQRVLGHAPSESDFENLTKDDILAFYQYSWVVIGCDKINDSLVAACCFDFAKNSQYGKREIQKVLKIMGYNVIINNIFDNTTLNIINKATKNIGAKNLCLAILAERQQYVQSLVDRDETQRQFLAGWTNRIEDWKAFVLERTKVSEKVTQNGRI